MQPLELPHPFVVPGRARRDRVSAVRSQAAERVQAWLGAAGMVVVHLRPPATENTDSMADDEAAAEIWLAEWAGAIAAADCRLLVCRGQLGGAAPPPGWARLVGGPVVTVESALAAAGAWEPLCRVVGGCSEQDLLCAVELAVSGLASALVVTNTALSFAAALLAPQHHALGLPPPPLAEGVPRFWRVHTSPQPTVAAFDPWASQPVLREVRPGH